MMIFLSPVVAEPQLNAAAARCVPLEGPYVDGRIFAHHCFDVVDIGLMTGSVISTPVWFITLTISSQKN